MSILFDLSRLPELANPNFAVPLIPSVVHEDSPKCDHRGVIHMAPDSFDSPASRQRLADLVSASVGAGDARRAERASKPAGYWDTIDPRTLGADANRVWGEFFHDGYGVGRDDEGGRDATPPAWLDSFQRAAWTRGYEAGQDVLVQSLMHEADDEMSHSPEEFAEARMVSPYAEWRD